MSITIIVITVIFIVDTIIMIVTTNQHNCHHHSNCQDHHHPGQDHDDHHHDVHDHDDHRHHQRWCGLHAPGKDSWKAVILFGCRRIIQVFDWLQKSLWNNVDILLQPHQSKLLFWKYSFQFRPLLLLPFSSVTLVGTFGFHYRHHRSCSISVKPPSTFSFPSLFQAASPPGQVRRWDPRHWHPFQIFCLERERGRQGWYYHHQHHSQPSTNGNNSTTIGHQFWGTLCFTQRYLSSSSYYVWTILSIVKKASQVGPTKLSPPFLKQTIDITVWKFIIVIISSIGLIHLRFLLLFMIINIWWSGWLSNYRRCQLKIAQVTCSTFRSTEGQRSDNYQRRVQQYKTK